MDLRRFTKRDIPELFSWFETERDVLEWAGAGLSWPLNRRAFVDLVKQGATRELWAVDADGAMIGHFQITLNRRLQTAGLGRLALAPVARGQGRAAPFMDLILHRAFSHTWVHRVDLLVYSHNAPAIAAYRAAGFTLEGTRRETTPFETERWHTHIMSILRYEFDKRTERE
ncbi:MAG: GNAT family protein [Pseudomonadota bacterium]